MTTTERSRNKRTIQYRLTDHEGNVSTWDSWSEVSLDPSLKNAMLKVYRDEDQQDQWEELKQDGIEDNGKVFWPMQYGMMEFRWEPLVSAVRHVGCTVKRHEQIGVHAQINARGGEAWRNDHSDRDNQLWRDALRIHHIMQNVRVYQFESRWFQKRFSHLLADRSEVA